MAMDKDEIVKYWVDKAREELEAAKDMFIVGRYLYTGFMCHQCVEKALKGCYVHTHNKRQPHEHRLDKLIEMLGLHGIINEQQQSVIEKLNPLYLQTRYDDYKRKIDRILTKSYCETLLAETEELLLWIVKLMK